jgi:hypothetical protein
MSPAQFAVNELTVAIEKSAFVVFNASGFKFGLNAQGCKFAHGVWQERDAHTQLAHFGHCFKHMAWNTALVQMQSQGQPADAAANDGNVDLVGDHEFLISQEVKFSQQKFVWCE